VQREHRQQRSLLGGAERNPTAVEGRLDRPEQVESDGRMPFLGTL